jgi:hypothetical protein
MIRRLSGTIEIYLLRQRQASDLIDRLLAGIG